MSALERRGGKVSLFKASPFGAPAPEAQESDSEGDDDFFSRSKHTYAILAAEDEDRKKRKAEREKDVELTAGVTTSPSGKKQRVDSHAEYLKSTQSASGLRTSSKGFTESPDASPKNKSTLSEGNSAPDADADLRRNQDATLPEIINLEDAESDKLDTS